MNILKNNYYRCLYSVTLILKKHLEVYIFEELYYYLITDIGLNYHLLKLSNESVCLLFYTIETIFSRR